MLREFVLVTSEPVNATPTEACCRQGVLLSTDTLVAPQIAL